MNANRTSILFTLTCIVPLSLLSATANAQFGGRAGRAPGPVPFRGMSPSPNILPATVARQNTLPLFAPLAPQFIGQSFSRWGTYGGFSYYPGFAYNSGFDFGYTQPNYLARNYRLPFLPPPFLPPRNFAVPAPVEVGNPDSARLTLSVPSGAEVFVGGKQIEMSGTERTIESPDLKSGDVFTFDVRVTWTEHGKFVEERRRLTLHASEHQSLQYLARSSSVPLRLER